MSYRGGAVVPLVLLLCMAIGFQVYHDTGPPDEWQRPHATTMDSTQIPLSSSFDSPLTTTTTTTTTSTPSPPTPVTTRPAVQDRYVPSTTLTDAPTEGDVDVEDLTADDWMRMKQSPETMANCSELARCRFRCDHDARNPINPCFRGCLCPTPDCVVLRANSTTGGLLGGPFLCLSNPFYARTPTTGRRGLSCVGERVSDPAPVPPNRSDFADGTTEQWRTARDLALFKRHTNQWLDNWVDWKEGPCMKELHDGGKMSYEYDAESHFYTVRNLCFRPNGPQAAFTPVRFGDSIFSDWNNDVYGGRNRASYFNSVRPLKEPAACYRDQKVLLDYIITPTHNTFFTALKSAAIRRFLDVHFNGTEDVLLLRILSNLARDDEAGHHVWSTHGYWRGALSKFGFAIVRESELDLGHEANEAMVCFDRVVMLHPCEMETCGGPSQGGNLPVLRWKVVVEGVRTPNEAVSVDAMRTAMVSCTGVRRPVPNVTHPRLVIVDRHHKKRYANLNMVMPAIADAAYRLGFYTLHVVDQQHGIEPIALARMHQRADVMIGHFGGGMTWLFLQPPASVVGSCIDQFGARWDPGQGNPCDYAGLANNAGVSHYTSIIPKAKRIGNEDFHLPEVYWATLLNLTLCRLRANAAAGYRRTFGDECPSPSQAEWEAMIPATPNEYTLSDP